jgi:hypothetical protein
VQAKKLRFQDASFETTTPKAAKEKLHAAVPARATVAIYNTPDEFNAARNHNKVMEWTYDALRAMPEPGPAAIVAVKN